MTYSSQENTRFRSDKVYIGKYKQYYLSAKQQQQEKTVLRLIDEKQTSHLVMGPYVITSVDGRT